MGTGPTGSLRSSYPPPDGRCKKTTLKDDSFQYQAQYSIQRQRAAPKKCYLKVGCFIWVARYFIQGHWSDGSLRSSYHTAHRAVQKDNLKRRFISISGSVLHSETADWHPPKRTFQKSIASYGQLDTLFKGNGQLPAVRRIM